MCVFDLTVPIVWIVQERQKKLIGSGSIGKMVAVQEKDRKYTEVLIFFFLN